VKKSKPIYARNSFINIKMSKEPACYYKLIQIINKGIWFFANTIASIQFQNVIIQLSNPMLTHHLPFDLITGSGFQLPFRTASGFSS